MKVPLTNNQDYVRDTESGAVVMNNKAALNKYMADREKRKLEVQKQKMLEAKVNQLQEELIELKKIVEEIKKK
jgi:hypothetical protein